MVFEFEFDQEQGLNDTKPSNGLLLDTLKVACCFPKTLNSPGFKLIPWLVLPTSNAVLSIRHTMCHHMENQQDTLCINIKFARITTFFNDTVGKFSFHI